MFKSKLGLDMGRSRLYQRPYVDAFDLIPNPAGWRVPNFVKFSGHDNRSTWDHISQYIAQLGEDGSSKSFARLYVFFVFDWNGFLLVFVVSPEFDSFLGRIRTKVS